MDKEGGIPPSTSLMVRGNVIRDTNEAEVSYILYLNI